LWDYDIGAQPILSKLNGQSVIVVATKLGFIFIFDKMTGEPVSSIIEVPVPVSDVPGEKSFPTQPHPENMNLRLGRYLINEDNLWGPNDVEKAKCLTFLQSLEGRQDGTQFTPPSRKGSLWNPGSRGGFNWGSCAWDPKEYLICSIIDQPLAVKLVVDTEEDPLWCTISQPQYGSPFGFCYA